MLRQITIRNYRALHAVDVPLRPITVLIGPNDTGKTSFLMAMERLVLGGDISRLDHWRGAPANEIEIIARTEHHTLALHAGGPGKKRRGSSIQYVQSIDDRPQKPEADSAATRASVFGVEEFRLTSNPSLSTAVHNALGGSFMRLQLPSDGPSLSGRGEADVPGPPEIGVRGDGMVAVLDHLARTDRKRFGRFVDAVGEFVPGLEDVTVRVPEATVRLVYVKQDGIELPASNLSAGTRFAIFYTALSFLPEPPALLLIEEPESGMHPHRIAAIVSLLREMSIRSKGRFAQVIFTTHSPYVLDRINLETDQVLVFRRAEDGSRTAEPVDAERLKKFLDEFMLGEIWFNEQEEGLVKRGD